MSLWHLRATLAAVAALCALIAIVPGAPAPAVAANGSWTGEYFNNLTLTGSPVLTRDDGPTLDFTWEDGPGPGVSADNWSARWQRTDTYTAGTYRLTVTGDDGVRVIVDGGLVLNAWVDQPPTTYFTDVALSAGSHTVRVDLYDTSNAATVKLTIQDVATIPQGWQGEYFNNKTLSGSPARTRNDGENIAFEWNASAPGSPFPGVIGNDNFSVRWTRQIDFAEGVYQFTTVSDDGVRLYVDGQLILDFWINQAPTVHSANKQMTAGQHTVVLEYFEAGGGASAYLDIIFRPELGGFVTEPIVTIPDVATAFQFAPDGRIFVAEKDGDVQIVQNGAMLPAPFYTVSPVNDYRDRGLIGITLDPNFATNGWVYLAYTYENNASDPGGLKTAQVIRVRGATPASNVADPATKAVLLGSQTGTPGKPSCENWPATADCIPSDYDSHSVGNLRFGADGMLYVATGDGASYASVDVRALRAQNIDRLSGKILRVNPATGAGLSDNPFYSGNTSDTRSKVWAYGMRNPFRFNFKPGTNLILGGDVGWDSWEEINKITAGLNLGWPCYEGADQQPGYAAYAQCQALYTAGTATPPLHTYAHPPSSAAVGGAFTGANGYSSAYQNTYFWGDYPRDQISVLRLDGASNLVPGSVDVFSSSGDGPVMIEVGPDGDIYYMSILTGEIRAIRFVGDNRAPVAVAAGSPTGGALPLTVNFSSAGSNDPDGQSITYDWDFGDGAPHSTAANPAHEYTIAGSYTATLTVTDPLFRTDTATVPIQAGNTPPVATITSPLDGSHYDIGQTINFTGTATDADQGTLPPSSMEWSIVFVHCTDETFTDCHTHPGVPATGASGSFFADDHGDFTYFDLSLTVTDAGGLQDTETISLTPNRVTLSFTSNRAGVQIAVESTSQTVPFTRSVPRGSGQTLFAPSPQTATGGATVYFSAWSDGGAQQHDVTANADTTYNAVFADPTPTPTPTPTATNTPTPTAALTFTPTPTVTPTPTATPVPPTGTATSTPTPTATSTPTPTACAGDIDCDGVTDAGDNCPAVANPSQENANGEIAVLPPPAAFDDVTNPDASPLGDACNPDIDNDGLTAPQEQSAGTNAALRDTDGDKVLDGPEVACGSDPLSPTSKPSGVDADGDFLPDACEAAAGSSTSNRDTDGDGVNDAVEYLRLGTNPASPSTDGDNCDDAREAASPNADYAVSAIDLSQIALRFMPSGGPGYHPSFDPNRDGAINALDLVAAAIKFGACQP